MNLNDIRMKPKLISLFLMVGIIPLAIAVWISFRNSSAAIQAQAFNQLKGVRDIKKAQIEKFFGERQGDMQVLTETVNTLREEAFAKLTAVREIKRSAVERYFQTIHDQIHTFSENKMVVDAVQQFRDAFNNYYDENSIMDTDIESMKQQLATYYTGEFRDEYARQNEGNSPGAQSIVQQLDRESIALQYRYIRANRNPLGSKHLLDSADDGSRYSELHAQIHPIVRNYLEKFGYYDIFLVDPETGDIVYSVFKELDYSTSLIDGPYAQTNFGEAFRMANAATDKDAVFLVDYMPYKPSYEAPASFIASPIFDGEEKVGVAIFQMPIDRLITIMSERAGLGETGETYLVGPDGLMRSDSYLDPENHSVTAAFKNPTKNKVDTMAVQSALAGGTGADVIMDYNGNPVLSAWIPVRVGNFVWALLAEIDVAEAFSPKDSSGEYFFKKYTEAYGYYDLFLMNPDGYVFYTVTQEADYQTNMVSGKYKDSGLGKLARKVLQSKQFALADFEPYAPSNNEPAAFIAQPVVINGKVELVVALQLSLEAINSIMQERSGMGVTGETYLVGSDQLMRSDSFLDPVNHTVAASFKNPSLGKVDTEGSKEAIAGKTGKKIIIDYNGNPVLSAYAPITLGDTKWVVLAEIDQAEAFSNLAIRDTYGKQIGLLGWALIVALSFAILILCIAYFIANSISSPLVNGVRFAEIIAEGDFTQHVDANRKDEIGALSKALNRMREKLSETLLNVSQATEQVSSSSEELAASSQNLSNAATEQAASLEETSASIEELSTAIEQNAENARNTDDRVNQASKLSDESLETAKKGIEQVQKLGFSMKEIQESSKEIVNVIDLITDIADQTNLLALNAAIEAARAGEAGKGFAVVAVEVRKLAERSQIAAKDIAQKIEKSSEIINEGSQMADESNAGLSAIQESAKQVAEALNEASTLVRDITASSLEQANGADQIRTAITQLDEVTQQNSATSEECASASEQLSAQAAALQELVSQFKIHNGSGQQSMASTPSNRELIHAQSFTRETTAPLPDRSSSSKTHESTFDDEFKSV